MSAPHDLPAVTCLSRGVQSLLTGWGVTANSPVTLLSVSENIVFRVDDARTGRTLAVRVHRPGYHTRAEILSELAWIEALRTDDVLATVVPLTRLDGEPIASFDGAGERRHAVAFAFVPGHEPPPDDSLADGFRTLGAISARLHRHAREWRRPADFVRKVWNIDTIVGARAHWGPWTNALGLDASGRETLAQAVMLITARLVEHGTGRERFGLIHADLRLANLLDNDGELTVIDFDDCGFGWFLFDLAAALSFIEEQPCVPALIAAWLAGYRDVAPLSMEDEAVVPAMILLRRVQLTAWLASHRDADIAHRIGETYTAGTVRLAKRFVETGLVELLGLSPLTPRTPVQRSPNT